MTPAPDPIATSIQVSNAFFKVSLDYVSQSAELNIKLCIVVIAADHSAQWHLEGKRCVGASAKPLYQNLDLTIKSKSQTPLSSYDTQPQT